MAVSRLLACLPNFVALVGLSSALVSLADTAPSFLSMKEPSFGSSPPGQSMLPFTRPRQSSAVVHAGIVVVVVGTPASVVVLVTLVVVVVLLAEAGGLATSAKGDSEFTVRQA